jgi:hypothetical protein
MLLSSEEAKRIPEVTSLPTGHEGSIVLQNSLVTQ